jgi:hypothetical protein
MFALGLIGSLILVTGAAWPDRAGVSPLRSVKDWLFAVGGCSMFAYSYLQWLAGGPIFFVILEALVVIATILMMLGTPDRFDEIILTLATLGMIVWSLYLFEGYTTVCFIIGLSGIGMGYALDSGTIRRGLALTLGSALIALFSYLEASWIFFWLNVFFALFSAWNLLKTLQGR